MNTIAISRLVALLPPAPGHRPSASQLAGVGLKGISRAGLLRLMKSRRPAFPAREDAASTTKATLNMSSDGLSIELERQQWARTV
ncbi:MAG: hypothetical protein JWM47_4489 [Acidimicrobiales bacterium]|nr:hypothetical protein [Acidimicrobiales bacterium]